MAERVVDRLEAVEVDQQQRSGVVVAARASQEVGDALLEAVAVQQSGERVVAGELVQLGLEHTALAVGADQRAGAPPHHRDEPRDRRRRQPPGAHLVVEDAP